MIHFPALMATTFVETPPTEQQPPTASHSGRPADYYSSPPGPRALPRWVPLGCGSLSLLILVIVFAGGSYFARGGFTEVLDLMFGMTMGEMRGMYQKDVVDAQKKTLEAEMKTMRGHLRAERVNVRTLQPMLKAMEKATGDSKLTAKEVDELVAAMRKVNTTARK